MDIAVVPENQEIPALNLEFNAVSQNRIQKAMEWTPVPHHALIHGLPEIRIWETHSPYLVGFTMRASA